MKTTIESSVYRAAIMCDDYMRVVIKLRFEIEVTASPNACVNAGAWESSTQCSTHSETKM